jgi:hypothetical protein
MRVTLALRRLGQEDLGQPGLCSEVQVSLSYMVRLLSLTTTIIMIIKTKFSFLVSLQLEDKRDDTEDDKNNFNIQGDK